MKRRYFFILVLSWTTVAVAQRVADEPPKRPAPSALVKRRAKPPTSAPASPQGTSDLQRQFRSALSAKDLNRASGVLSAALTALAAQKIGSSSDERVRWRLLESELELARGRPSKAGLAAMQVVILRPKSDWAGEGLYWTARAYEKMNRPAKAADLYRECLDRKGLSTTLRKSAEARSSALNRKASSK